MDGCSCIISASNKKKNKKSEKKYKHKNKCWSSFRFPISIKEKATMNEFIRRLQQKKYNRRLSRETTGRRITRASGEEISLKIIKLESDEFITTLILLLLFLKIQRILGLSLQIYKKKFTRKSFVRLFLCIENFISKI